jgi:hypothetical protein
MLCPLQVDLAVTSQFALLRLRPIIYPLQGFGIETDCDRIYDYRYEPRLNRSKLRDTAAMVLMQQANTAAMLNEELSVGKSGKGENASALLEVDDVSQLGDDESMSSPSKANTVTTAARLRSKLGGIRRSVKMTADDISRAFSQSQMDTGTAGGGDDKSEAASSFAGGPRDPRQQLLLQRNASFGASAMGFGSNSVCYEKRSLSKDGVRRLLPKFPLRDRQDRPTNIFEARAAGIGAAREEDEKLKQEELKKSQVSNTVYISTRRSLNN